MPITTSITLSLTYDEIRCLQRAMQKMNADLPGQPALDTLTSKIADIVLPAAQEAVADPPKAPAGS